MALKTKRNVVVVREDGDNYKCLACAVIESALDDYRVFSSPKNTREQRLHNEAMEFLDGGSMLKFWCDVAGVPVDVVKRGYRIVIPRNVAAESAFWQEYLDKKNYLDLDAEKEKIINKLLSAAQDELFRFLDFLGVPADKAKTYDELARMMAIKGLELVSVTVTEKPELSGWWVIENGKPIVAISRPTLVRENGQPTIKMTRTLLD